MSLSDIYAAQIEAHFFFYLALGASTTCFCLTMYVCTKMITEAVSRQKVVIEVPVYSQNAVPYGHNHRVVNGFISSELSRQTQHGLS